MKWVLGLATIATVAGLALYLTGMTGAGLLDLADRLTPGRSGAAHVAKGVHYGAGPRRKLDLYRPVKASGALPVLVFFYGGGWDSGRREDYRFAGEAYAAQGFLVVLPDYRLVPETRFPGFIQDGAAAIRWAQDNATRFGGDPERIVLAGHSAGAYIAAMLALDPQWLERAGVSPSHIRAMAGLAGPYDFHPFTTDQAINAFGAAPDPQATQPVNFVRHGAPPLWLATGGRDTVVKPRNSQALAAAQSRFAVARYREYPALDHTDIVMALARPFRGKAPVLAESAAFLKAAAVTPRTIIQD